MEGNKVNKTISKKPTGVFYIDGNKAFYFEQAISSPISLEIPVDTISNFELLNKKKLVVLIQSFIKNNKLIPRNIVILLSVGATFDKEFPHGSIEIQKNIQEFLELVPYEELLQRKLISSGKTRVIATNKEICEAIKSTFIASGFLVSGIYPLSLSLEIIPQLKTNLDLSLFVNKISDLKGINLQPVVEASYSANIGVSSSSSIPLEKDKPNRTRLFALVGLFAFLIIVLSYVIYANILSPSDEVSSDITPIPTLAPIETFPVDQSASEAEELLDASPSAENISTPSSTTGSF